MALPVPLPDSLSDALRYSLRYSYLLDVHELWFWQISSHYSQKYIQTLDLRPFSSRQLLALKRNRRQYSKSKWFIARRVGDSLSRIPTISAVFVTGSLAMNNSPLEDDIDLFIVTIPHTLWLTRFIVVIYLTFAGLRRPPYLSEHSSPAVSDKICDNLYLDSRHLSVSPANLYLAHEILQAKPLFDKSGIQKQFLLSNTWVQKYLPVAYSHTVSPLRNSVPASSLTGPLFLILGVINILFFSFQYLYMYPFRTREKIGLGAAYLHPRMLQ